MHLHQFVQRLTESLPIIEQGRFESSAAQRSGERWVLA
jgi:hypothetical protein